MIGRLRSAGGRIWAELAALFGWWIHELRDLGDALLLRIAPRLATRAFVRLEAAGGAISVLRGGLEEEALSFAEVGEIQLPELLRGARTTVALAAGDVLTHDLRLPRVVKGELDRIIDLYLERELPLPRGRVRVCHRVLPQDRAHRQMSVRIYIANRERIEEVRERLTRAGLRPTRVGVAGDANDVIGNFLKDRSRSERFRFTSLDRQLAGLAAALAVATVGTVAGQWLYERVQVGRELHRTRDMADSTKSLMRELEGQSAPGAALIRLSGWVDATQVLPSLSEAIPRDSWIYQLDVSAPPMQAPQIRLTGFAPAATMLADTLEKSPHFEKVRLISAVSAGLGSARDRLELSAEWELK